MRNTRSGAHFAHLHSLYPETVVISLVYIYLGSRIEHVHAFVTSCRSTLLKNFSVKPSRTCLKYDMPAVYSSNNYNSSKRCSLYCVADNVYIFVHMIITHALDTSMST